MTERVSRSKIKSSSTEISSFVAVQPSPKTKVVSKAQVAKKPATTTNKLQAGVRSESLYRKPVPSTSQTTNVNNAKPVRSQSLSNNQKERSTLGAGVRPKDTTKVAASKTPTKSTKTVKPSPAKPVAEKQPSHPNKITSQTNKKVVAASNARKPAAGAALTAKNQLATAKAATVSTQSPVKPKAIAPRKVVQNQSSPKSLAPTPRNHPSTSVKSQAPIDDGKVNRPRTATKHKGPPVIIFVKEDKNKTDTSENEIPNEEDFGSLPRRNEVDSGFVDSKDTESATSEYDYEEDFEDYESDFEELSESGQEESEDVEESEEDSTELQSEPNEPAVVKPKVAPLVGLNESVTSQRITKSEVIPKTEPISILKSSLKESPSTQLLNFSFSKSVKKFSSRGQELLDLITLDKQAFGIYESPPINYELFIEVFGHEGRKQAFTQTEVGEEKALQTDDLEYLNKWTQQPAEGGSSVGGQGISANVSGPKADGLRLGDFLRASCRVISRLIDEEARETVQLKLDQVPFSRGYLELNTVASVTSLCFSGGDGSYLMTVEQNEGFLRIWNLRNFSLEFLLEPCGLPTKGAFNPGPPSIAFSGMEDGSISMWDLRDQMPIQKNKQGRSATYNSAMLEAGSRSPVVDLQVIVPSGTFREARLCQVVTLEELGSMHIWTVVQVQGRPDLAGNPDDLGMSPGAQIKLVHSSMLRLPPNTVPSCFSVGPEGLIVAGSEYGLVWRCDRQGPSLSRFKLDNISPVTSISFNKRRPGTFCVGCSDGVVSLFDQRRERPLFTLVRPEKIVRVEWSPVRSSLLFLHTKTSRIEIWDLARDSTNPSFSYDYKELLSFCLPAEVGGAWLDHVAVALEGMPVRLHALRHEITLDQEDDDWFLDEM